MCKKDENVKKCENIIDDKKQKMKDYQKQYTENMTDEQKQKIKDY